jgi:uncharacterized protein (DUF362 family)
MQEHGPARRLSVVDGIHAGEGNGPFCPRLKRAHTLIAGEDFLEVDCVATRLMGFDCEQVPYLRHLMRTHGLRVEDIAVHSDAAREPLWNLAAAHLDFLPPDGWACLTAGRTAGSRSAR